ncbi:MAG: type II toxin-antitoxin system RelE/ParE family toxin [Euryarchaeota archaeon]|nr:type II toxin-antitoxin system RelE/ParE family toxin [Euryarchaeota archaeon]
MSGRNRLSRTWRAFGIIFQNYRIIYRVETDSILILTIIHGARDLSRKIYKPWDVI